MTTSTEQLKALAEAAKRWNLNFVMNMTDEEPCEVGWKDEDGCFYPLITVDCENYFQPSGPLATYIAAANPERILALIAENEKMIAACALYDKALLSIYPTGAGGAAWELWNSARKTLGETK